MRVTKSTVEKLVIRDAPVPDGWGVLDPVSVYLEEYGPGQGKITIEVFGEAWSSYWGAMGEQHTLMSFFLKASPDYLAGKLKSGIEHEMHDLDADRMQLDLKREIIRQRREGDIGRQTAREYWTRVPWVDELDYSDLYADVFGDDWWSCLPKKPNPKYGYLLRVIHAVKAGLKEVQDGHV